MTARVMVFIVLTGEMQPSEAKAQLVREFYGTAKAVPLQCSVLLSGRKHCPLQRSSQLPILAIPAILAISLLRVSVVDFHLLARRSKPASRPYVSPQLTMSCRRRGRAFPGCSPRTRVCGQCTARVRDE